MSEERAAVRHHFTVDVEEYYQVSALEPFVSRESWATRDSRVAVGTDRLLALLDEAGARGTHFVLGCVAERNPEVVRRIAAGGHEIASHGWDHRRVTEQTPEEFRASIRRTKAFLEDLTGEQVVGFRAPSFSIVEGREWALDILLEEGYGYDSSLFPVQRRGYGYASGARDPHWLTRPGGRLAEVPPATLRRLGRNLPAGGGGDLRLLPFALVHGAFAEAQARGVPATFYIHPWELDPAQPRVAVDWKTRIRHYTGLARTEGRIRRLLATFRFGPIRDTLATPQPA